MTSACAKAVSSSAALVESTAGEQNGTFTVHDLTLEEAHFLEDIVAWIDRYRGFFGSVIDPPLFLVDSKVGVLLYSARKCGQETLLTEFPHSWMP